MININLRKQKKDAKPKQSDTQVEGKYATIGYTVDRVVSTAGKVAIAYFIAVTVQNLPVITKK